MENCEIRPLSAPSLSYNQMGELDLHRPYIDQVKIDCRCGGEMRRVKEVFDCWFESGSMPYGQSHYPFENKKKWEKNFPAQFISEALDQTRGWFYSLLVLSTALFKKIAFKNVVVSGMIMAADGKKLSKRLKNYSDPMTIVENYGADALRCYLLSSPVVYGENLNFSDQGVNEIYKKIILRLNNVFNFYKLYQDTGPTPNAQRPTPNASKKIANFTIIDQWILARLDSLNREIVQAMENYCLDQAVRPIGDFVDDLSTWYLRRSRDRFKEEGEEKKQAILMMELVLGNLAKMMAPFLPFLSEYLYSEVDGRQESVHLERWPELRIKNKELRIKNNKSQNLIKAMGEIRKLASLALEARSKLGIKVRQPLAKLKIRDQQLKGQRELLQILAEEVNVKEIEFDPEIDNEVWLDQVITQDLKEEGLMREFVRLVQEMRKDGQLKPQDSIDLSYSGDFEIPEHFNLFLKNKLKAKKIQKGIGAKEVFLVTKEILLDGTHKILVGIKN
ncbi:class I tRNA ligase family protein [Candidatus Azambacteria bacterium]|nr:class I tRNA ligase family protein [Candidatus Azambacteria bacterium]